MRLRRCCAGRLWRTECWQVPSWSRQRFCNRKSKSCICRPSGFGRICSASRRPSKAIVSWQDWRWSKTIGKGAASERAEPRIAGGRYPRLKLRSIITFPNWRKNCRCEWGPLREQWEARGPGFLQQIGLLTEEALLVEQAEVVVLHPALGGSGQAWLAGNQVRIEGCWRTPFRSCPKWCVWVAAGATQFGPAGAQRKCPCRPAAASGRNCHAAGCSGGGTRSGALPGFSGPPGSSDPELATGGRRDHCHPVVGDLSRRPSAVCRGSRGTR